MHVISPSFWIFWEQNDVNQIYTNCVKTVTCKSKLVQYINLFSYFKIKSDKKSLWSTLKQLLCKFQ